jgi:prephenate dehydrogenase
MNSDKNSKYTVGIIGYGNFGRTLEALLRRDSDLFEIKIFSRGEDVDNQKFYDLADTINSDLVFPCVPISVFEDWLQEKASLFEARKSDVAVVEVCSVNKLPSEWMQEYLPESVDLISSHPLFGPSSSKGGTEFESLKFVVHPLRVSNQEKLSDFQNFLEGQGLEFFDLSPEEHDRQIARSQAYGFILGKIGNDLGIQSTQVDTPWFELILKNQNMVAADTDQLFHDMFAYNPEAEKLLKEMNQLTTKFIKKLDAEKV